MSKKGQLSLAGYVVLVVVFVFIAACAYFVYPILSGVVGTDPSYSTGYDKYLVILLPAVLLIGGIVMFFMPNTVVR